MLHGRSLEIQSPPGGDTTSQSRAWLLRWPQKTVPAARLAQAVAHPRRNEHVDARQLGIQGEGHIHSCLQHTQASFPGIYYKDLLQ